VGGDRYRVVTARTPMEFEAALNHWAEEGYITEGYDYSPPIGWYAVMAKEEGDEE